MSEIDVTPALVVENGNRGDLRAMETKQEPPSRITFLLLPPEIRRLIFQILFQNLKVKNHKRDQPKDQYLCCIMRVCRLCGTESLAVFYQSVTIMLQHESFLYVLRSRIGGENMARIRQLFIGRYDSTIPTTMVLHLPHSLDKLYLEWTHRSAGWIMSPTGTYSDADMCGKLVQSLRVSFGSCVEALWASNPRLQIFVDFSFTCNELPVRTWNVDAFFSFRHADAE